ncbi:SDR family NAD(P)-dependent oxidoreductase [Comamonas testosteroni]|jgi:NAD(P)-dependent dehydrogenase (short-subunit alcohol dehydrogenase family)|uniref:SDR family NAD(P)-dependent oxidoreductase n=1 Tax=Comamonas testosteroni TaxID=285 RepID=UPI002660357B|nr:SDR family oxidoreductase [Comamonas testosteroni]WKL16934.1 SDR family oxidoreductase [Comamonas testosteroni]WQD44570.1 SDR family oxidoreductase [Comamonas testosteroni]
MSRPVVLITGASRGIGAATAVFFAVKGWRVAITARTLSEGAQMANQLRLPGGQLLSGSLESTAKAIEAAGGEVFAHVMDLMDLSSLDKAADAVLKRFGRVDLLINNAVYQNREINHLIPEITAESLQRCMQGNVIAPFHLAQRLLPAMAAQGGGRIINVCSAAGQYNPPVPADQGGWGFAYGASKAAIARLAGCINTEYKQQNVRAFSVNPGVVTTEAVKATLGDDGLLAQRYGASTPEEIAEALFWLGTEKDALPLAKSYTMIDLQPLHKERVAATT